MNNTKRERLFRKLNEQIQILSRDTPLNFLLLGGSLEKMYESNLYKDKYSNFETYIRKELPMDRSVVFKLRRVYKYFRPYKNRGTTWKNLCLTGWRKARLLVVNHERFEDGLGELFDIDRLVNFANYLSSSELKEQLEKKTKLELFASISYFGYPGRPYAVNSLHEALIRKIGVEISLSNDFHRFTLPSEWTQKDNLRESLPATNLKKTKEAVRHLLQGCKHFSKLETLLDSQEGASEDGKSFKGFLGNDLTHRNNLTEASVPALMFRPTEKTLGGLIVRVKKMARFLDRKVVELIDWAKRQRLMLIVRTNSDWEEIHWTRPLMQHLFWESKKADPVLWCDLKNARRAQLIDKYLREGLKMSKAAEKAKEIIKEEINYSLWIYYYRLADKLGTEEVLDNFIEEERYTNWHL